MNKKKSKPKNKPKNKPSRKSGTNTGTGATGAKADSATTKPIDATTASITEEAELTGVEEFVEKVKPYGSLIALVAALAFLAFIAVTYFIKAGQDQKELEWRQLNNSITEVGISGNTNPLRKVADDNPAGKAGMWALQLAGDYDLRTGLSQISYDREGGMKLIEKARDALQDVVDGPQSAKSAMLQQRSTFSLAYAQESLGEFAAAKALYQKIVDEAGNTAFAGLALRGLERTSSPQYAALFDKFKNYEDELGDAPGAVIPPDRPDISFPGEGEKIETGGGGEFKLNDDPAPETSAPETSDATEKAGDQ